MYSYTFFFSQFAVTPYFPASIPQTSRLTRWRFVWDFLSGIYLFFVKGNSGESSSQLDDRLSLSSNEVESEEEMGDQDDNSQIDDGFNRFTSNRANTSKRTKGMILCFCYNFLLL